MSDRPASQAPFDVFLSYARNDDEPFVRKLCGDLSLRGVRVWWDRAAMESRGLAFLQEIRDAIAGIDRVVLVVGPNAVTSEYVRVEWAFALERCKVVVPILRVGASGMVPPVLHKEDYELVPYELSHLHVPDFRDDIRYDAALDDLVRVLTVPLPTLASIDGVDPLPPHFLPRTALYERLRASILTDAIQPVVVTSERQTIALEGMGGVGKSVLAAAFARACETRRSFGDGILWIRVGRAAPETETEMASLVLLGRIAEGLGRPVSAGTLNQMLTSVTSLLEKRRCLIVLDDVWAAAPVSIVAAVAGPLCRVLATTRDASIAVNLQVEPCRVDVLDESAALKLLSEWAGLGAGALPSVATDLVAECGRLALAIAMVGAMVRGRPLDRWDDTLARLRAADLAKIRRDFPRYPYPDLLRAVGVSIDALDPVERERYLDLAVFPEDESIPGLVLETLWQGCGLSPADMHELVDLFVDRSLARRVGDGIQLHDLQRDYVVRQTASLAALHVRLLDAYRQQCPRGWASGPRDGYFFEHLPWHLKEGTQVNELQALLLKPEWLDAKLRAADPYALIRDFDLVKGHRELEVVQAALRLALPALVGDANQLCEQLWGRLPLEFSERLESFRSDLTRAGPHPRLRARWPNLQGPGSGLVQTLIHEGRVIGALLLPDGHALSWSADTMLRIWDLATGEGRALSGHKFAVSGALLLPDGRALSWSNDTTLRVWNLATGEGRALIGHNESVTGALLLPDRRGLSWSEDGTLRVWDLATGEGRALTGHEGSVTGALLLPDGRALSWSEDATLRIWDLAAGEGRVLTGHEGPVNGALLLPDGRALSWSDDCTLWLRNLATGEGHALSGHQEAVYGALLLPTGCALSWSGDRTLRIWDLATDEGRALFGHEFSVGGALLLPDGRALSWSDEGALRVWNFATDESYALIGHEGGVHGALLLPDTRALTWGHDGTLRIWDLTMGEGRALTGHEESVTGALVVPDGRLVSWSHDRTLRVWELATGGGLALTAHGRCVNGALLLPDGRGLSWSEDGTLRVWDLATREVRPLLGHERAVSGALLLPDGRLLSWSKDGTLRIWDLATHEERTLTCDGEGWVKGALPLSDGRVVSWSQSRVLRVWDLATGESRALIGHDQRVDGALLMPDGRALSWSFDGTLRVWELATGDSRAFIGHDQGVDGALLLPDECALSWSMDSTLRVWNIATGESRALSGHEHWVTGALLLPDGRALSWSRDSTLVWDLATGEGCALSGHDAPINGALLLPDGRALSWSEDGTLRVWDPATGAGRALWGHEAPVMGALLLPDGRALSWSVDCSIRIRDVDRNDPGLAFYFDATPTVVVPEPSGGLLVGDTLGRIHVLEILNSSVSR